MIPETLPSRRLTRRQGYGAALRTVIALDRRRCDLHNAACKDRVFVELPEPEFAGWERYFYIRRELAHSGEASALARLLAIVQNVEHSNRRDFAARDYEHGGKLAPTEHRLREIEERKFFDEMPSDLRPYFAATRQRDRRTGHVSILFVVRNPEARFLSRVRPYYFTHRALPNSEALSELAFVEKTLYGKDFPIRHLIRHRGEWKDDAYLRDAPGPIVEAEEIEGWAILRRMSPGITGYVELIEPPDVSVARHDAAGLLRCLVTRNPCGTDTWTVGKPCSCGNCKVYLREQAVLNSLPDRERQGKGDQPVR